MTDVNSDTKQFLKDVLPFFHGRSLTYVDVGAYLGKVFEEVLSSGLKVREAHLIDPNKTSLDAARDATEKLFKGDCLMYHHLALGRQQGHLTLRPAKSMTKVIGSPELTTSDIASVCFEAECSTLDSLSALLTERHISLLKVDAEGCESDVLKGASNLLRDQSVDVIYIEAGMNPEGQQQCYYRKVEDILLSFGYRLFRIYEQQYEWIADSPFLRRVNLAFMSQHFARNNPFKLSKELYTAIAQANKLSKDLEAARALQVSTEKKNEQQESLVQDLQSALSCRDRSLEALKADIQTLTAKLTDSARSVEQAKAAAAARIATLEKEFAISNANANELRAGAHAAEQARVAAVQRVAQLEKELAASVSQFTAARSATDSAEQALAAIRQRVAELENELAARVLQLDDMRAVANTAEQARTASVRRIAELENDLAASASQLDDVRVAAGSAEQARAASLQRVAELQNELAASASQLKHSLDARDSAERARAAIVNEVTELERKLALAVANDRATHAAADEAMTRVLCLQQELTATTARFNNISALRDREILQHAETVRVLEEQLSAREADLKQHADRLNKATATRKSLESALVSSDAELAKQNNSLAQATNEVLQLKNQCKDLSEHIDLLVRERRVLEASSQSEVSRLRRKLSTVQTRSAKRAKQLQNGIRQRELLRKELTQAKGALEDLASRVEAIAASRRWKFGDSLGRICDKILLRQKAPGMIEHVRGVLENVRTGDAGRSSGEALTARQTTEHSCESSGTDQSDHSGPLPHRQHHDVERSSTPECSATLNDKVSLARSRKEVLHPEPVRDFRGLNSQEVACRNDLQHNAAPLSSARPAGLSLSYSDIPRTSLSVKGAMKVNGAHKNAPTVSVVMTAFNAEKTIRKSIESILQQQMSDLELIVVDDKSSDATANIVKDIRSRDKRVRLLQCHANRGTYWAKNLGILHARGRFIALNDSDDVSKPTRLRRQIEEFTQEPNKRACYTNWMRVDQHGAPILNRGLYERLGYPTLMFPRALMEDIGFFDSTRIAADDEFHKRILKKHGASTIAHIREAHYLAAMEENSLTARNPVTMTLRDPNDPLSFLSDDRRRYVDQYGKWHTEHGQTLCMPFPQRTRPFPIPPGMRSESVGTDEIIIGSVASFPKRIEGLKRVVHDVIEQVDLLRVHLNNYDSVPAFLRHPRIRITRSQQTGDLRDNGKFLDAEKLPDGFHITFDDDLAYPPYYVSYLIAKVLQYDKKAIVGVHGTLISNSFVRYHDKNSRQTFTYRLPLVDDKLVHVLGTGTTAYHTSALKFGLSEIPSKGMVDIWLATKTKREGIPMVCVSRGAGWLSDQEGFSDTSLYQEYLNNDSEQTALVAGARLWEVEHSLAI